MPVICPSCGYETFHPKATNCDLCAAPLNPSAAPSTAAAADMGDLEAMATAVAAGEASATTTSESAPKPKSASARKPAAPSAPAPPREAADPLNALLFVLALPVTLPVAVWGLVIADSPKDVPLPAWLVCGLLALLGAAGAVLGAGLSPVVSLGCGAAALCGGFLLLRTGKPEGGVPALILGAIAGLAPLLASGGGSIPSEFTLRKHRDLVHVLAFSPEGTEILSGSEDQRAILWDLVSGEPRFELGGHKKGLSGVAFAGAQLATASWDGTIQLWDRATGKLGQRLEVEDRGVSCMVVTPQGDLAVFGTPTGSVKLASLTDQQLVELGQHEASVTALAIDPDGKLVASASADGRIRVWSIEDRSELFELEGHERSVRALAFASKGQRIVSGGYDRFLRVWSASGELEHEVKSLSPIRTLATRGDEAVTVQANRILVRWNLLEGKQLGLYKLSEGRVPPGAILYTRSGTHLALADGKLVRSIPLAQFSD